MSSHSLNTRAHKSSRRRRGIIFHSALKRAHPKTKKSSRERGRASDPPPRAAPLENHARRFFCARFHRFASKRAFATPFFARVFSLRVALHRTPPSTPRQQKPPKRRRKKGRKKIAHKCYADKEREKERKKKRNARKETATRITHVSPSLRSSAVFFRRVAREDCRCRERDFLSCIRTRKKLREGRHFETLNDNSLGGGRFLLLKRRRQSRHIIASRRHGRATRENGSAFRRRRRRRRLVASTRRARWNGASIIK